MISSSCQREYRVRGLQSQDIRVRSPGEDIGRPIKLLDASVRDRLVVDRGDAVDVLNAEIRERCGQREGVAAINSGG